jgi:hypothetical protein
VTAIAFEEGAGLHCERFVQDVAFDMASRAEQNLACAYAALHAATHCHFFGAQLAMNESLFANHETGAAYVAFDPAIDLDVTGREKGAVYHQIRTDDRRI